MQRAHNDCNADGRLEEPLSAFSVFMRRLVSAGRERTGQMIKVHRARMMKKMKVRFIAELARLKGWRVDGDSERKHSAVHFGPKAGSNLLIRTLGLWFPCLKGVRSLTSLSRTMPITFLRHSIPERRRYNRAVVAAVAPTPK